jgi:NAD(P)H dehydrogenase (quinone)
MTRPILITGASGNIGRELVRLLQARGADFAVMTHRPGSAPPGVREVHGDFSRRETLDAAFAGVHTLFLLFPLQPGMQEMARNAVAAAQEAGVRHIVRSSGAGADSASPVSLARAHGEIDDVIAGSGIAATLLRPGMFMQNLIQFSAATIKGSGAIFAPHGDGAMGVVDVRDIAEAAAAVLLDPTPHAGAVYTLTGDAALTDAQMAATLSRAVGREIRYVDVPEHAAVDSMTQMGFPAQLVDWLMSLNHVVKQGWAAGLTDDVRKLTGHAPRTLQAFVEEHAAVWR